VKQRSEIMAIPERDTVYTNDGNRTVYTRESSGTGWFVGIIVALALLAIGYLVFSANSGPSTTVDVNGAPAVEAPADPTLAPAPMTEAPAAPATDAAPMTEAAPATDAAPAVDAAPATEAPAVEAPATEAAPAAEPAAPAV
jgi:cytoskeletal protein RodZ